MGVKRAREEPPSAGVQRKRQRNKDARSIATQSASQSLRQGALPIQDFLNARRFEIRALRDSMRKSRESGVQRAFQSLPRYLRRRAASHNPKRVPKRLRSRARAEIDDADGGASKNKRVPFKRKRGRRETIRKLAQLRERKVEEQAERLEGTPLPAFKATEGGRFCKRQRNKTWLPSHLWTSKRAHMLTRWGYALPQSPNEKTYRSTHRASKAKGVIIFDTSYMCTLILQGRATHIASLLDDLTRSKEAGGLRARRGARAVEAHAFNKTYLCPISVLWDGSSTDTQARVQLRLHPTAFASVWQVLVLMRKEKQLYLVRIIDARFSLGSIELVGPMAVNTLLTVLKSNADDEYTRLFKSLHGLLPKEVPANVVLPLVVRDSRRPFPPRLITEPAKTHNKLLNDWPNQGPGSHLFLVDQIDQCNRSRPSQSDIDKSKSELPNDTIPVLLTRTRLGFCLQAPWATITDFWYSFNHIPHVRFGGVQEYKQVHYESSVPHFPTDFPGTHAGDTEAKHLRDELQVAHLRRPPAKRQNWDKSINGKPELGDPFACDWYFLLQQHANALKTSKAPAEKSMEVTHIDATLLPVSQPAFLTFVDGSTKQLCSSPVSETGSMYMDVDTVLPASIHGQHTQVEDSFASRPITAPLAIAETNVPVTVLTPVLIHACELPLLVDEGRSHPRGIVQVKITLTGRGCPSARARIYSAVESSGEPIKSYQPGELIGFLTTGNFDLGKGKATGLGCLVLDAVLKAYSDARQLQARSSHEVRVASGSKAGVCQGRCFVRDVGTGNFREATWALTSSFKRVVV